MFVNWIDQMLERPARLRPLSVAPLCWTALSDRFSGHFADPQFASLFALI